MDVYELVERVGGEIVRGKARVRQGAEYVVLGYNDGARMVFTEAGAAMVAEMEAEQAPKRGGGKREPKPAPVVVPDAEILDDRMLGLED